MPKLLFFCGSNSSHSLNAKLALAARQVAEAKGAMVEFIDLADYPMPLYDADIQEQDGIPEPAVKLKHKLQDADGAFIACPEYNGSFTPLLKNAIDWVSRVREGDEPSLAAFIGKVYAIGSASPGAMGGMRCLVMLRMLLGNMGVVVVPSQVAVGKAMEAFSDDGSLSNDRQAAMLDSAVSELIRFSAAA